MVENNRIKVALVGNPNSGKSTLFNQLTGLNQKIANFPGVTVEQKSGIAHFRKRDKTAGSADTITFEIIDLPGTYSLYPKTLEEQVPFRVLCDPENELHPDLTIVIADGTNLKRSLFLCTQIIDLNVPCILAVNMIDMVRNGGVVIDFELLSEKLGIPVLPISAHKGEGIEELKESIVANSDKIPSKEFIDSRLLAPALVDEIRSKVKLNSNYAAFQVANNLKDISFFSSRPERSEQIKRILDHHEFSSGKLQAIETLKRYEVIADLMKSVVAVNKNEIRGYKKITEQLDRILMHRVFGYIIFLVIMFIMFQSVFAWASYPMEFVDYTFTWLSNFVHDSLPEGVLNDLLVEGILAGLGGVVIFIPQIALLFFFISLLEDTGYMARVSFMMDKLLKRFGLNGRSVIPMISGVACAVPAILSTRTIGNWRDRLITIMVTPLMSCSARLPVYALLISLVIPEKTWFGLFNLQGMVLMGLYLIGFLAAIGSALILKFIIKARERSYFIMEIPLYRMPRWKNILITIIEKVKVFVFEAGKIIVAISIVLWVLASTGPGQDFDDIAEQLSATDNEQIHTKNELSAQKLSASYAGQIGKFIEPVIAPLGFDWKIGIAIITSFAAREVFVGTMSTIYSVGGDTEDLVTVREKMRQEVNPLTGEPRYNLAVGVSLMVFYAFALQCVSTLAVVRRETGSWKWPLFQFAYMGLLAYISSLLIYWILS